jgi:hypothetical protein
LRKLLFGNASVVIFFEEGEELWLDGLEPGMVDRESVSCLLDAAGIPPGEGKLFLELFKNDGRSVLFISAPEETNEAREIYEFDNLDALLDCVEYIVPDRDIPQRSSLYEYRGKYYLLLSPPICCQTALLTEFGKLLEKPGFCWFLEEHGHLISAPSALTVLKRYF